MCTSVVATVTKGYVFVRCVELLCSVPWSDAVAAGVTMANAQLPREEARRSFSHRIGKFLAAEIQDP